MSAVNVSGCVLPLYATNVLPQPRQPCVKACLTITYSLNDTISCAFSRSSSPTYAPQLETSLAALLEDILRAWDANEAANREHAESTVLNLIDDSLSRSLRRLRCDIEEDADQRSNPALTGLVETLGAKIEGLSVAGLRQSESAMIRNMALDMARLRWPVPRFACLLPLHVGQLTEEQRALGVWSKRLQEWCRDGKKQGKGRFKRRLRLFFLCASDFSLAECGPGGQGYEVNEVLDWVKKARPVANLGLTLGKIALSTCTGLHLSGGNDVVAALGGTLGETVSSMLENAQAWHSKEPVFTVSPGQRAAGGDFEQRQASTGDRQVSPRFLFAVDFGLLRSPFLLPLSLAPHHRTM